MIFSQTFVFDSTTNVSDKVVGIIVYVGKNGHTYRSLATRVWVGKHGITWYSAGDKVKRHVKFRDHKSADFISVA